MALLFPDAPTPGELYPADPGTSGVTQYRWNNTKGTWDAVFSTVSLGVANQGAFNNYKWPATDGAADEQLTTDGAGNLTWEVPAAPSMQILRLDRPFNGNMTTGVAFTLLDAQSLTPVIPVPSTNLLVFLGGVPQIPNLAYQITPGTSTITFLEPPPTGTTFYAITNVIA